LEVAVNRITEDPRIDPRIKTLMGAFPSGELSDVKDRDALLAEVNEPEAVAAREQLIVALDALDNEDVAPSTGLDIRTLEFTSSPDGNTVKIQFIRPQSADAVPCVYYIHGGGMSLRPAGHGATSGAADGVWQFRKSTMAPATPWLAMILPHERYMTSKHDIEAMPPPWM